MLWPSRSSSQSRNRARPLRDPPRPAENRGRNPRRDHDGRAPLPLTVGPLARFTPPADSHGPSVIPHLCLPRANYQPDHRAASALDPHAEAGPSLLNAPWPSPAPHLSTRRHPYPAAQPHNIPAPPPRLALPEQSLLRIAAAGAAPAVPSRPPAPPGPTASSHRDQKPRDALLRIPPRTPPDSTAGLRHRIPCTAPTLDSSRGKNRRHLPFPLHPLS